MDLAASNGDTVLGASTGVGFHKGTTARVSPADRRRQLRAPVKITAELFGGEAESFAFACLETACELSRFSERKVAPGDVRHLAAAVVQNCLEQLADSETLERLLTGRIRGLEFRDAVERAARAGVGN